MGLRVEYSQVLCLALPWSTLSLISQNSPMLAQGQDTGQSQVNVSLALLIQVPPFLHGLLLHGSMMHNNHTIDCCMKRSPYWVVAGVVVTVVPVNGSVVSAGGPVVALTAPAVVMMCVGPSVIRGGSVIRDQPLKHFSITPWAWLQVSSCGSK